MFEAAVNYLREQRHIKHISIYGQSMGSIFAVLTAQYVGGMENLIMVSPHMSLLRVRPKMKNI